MKRFPEVLTLFFILTFSGHGKAWSQIMDSIHVALTKKPRLTFNFDTRNSFITNTRVKFFGIKAGVDFGNTIRFGGGYHFLHTFLTPSGSVTDVKTGLMINDPLRLEVRYVAVYAEYFFNKLPKWDFSIPIQIGAGNSYYYTVNNKSQKFNEKIIVLYEPTLTVQYKLMRWVGIGMGLGFRLMAVNNRGIAEKMNSSIYIFNLKINSGEIYRWLCPKKRK